MNKSLEREIEKRKCRIARRNRVRQWTNQERPMFRPGNIRYECSSRDRGIACGGIGAMYLMAKNIGLLEAIDRKLHLLKVHLPYHESDHVMNVALNILAGGECLQDLELLRHDEAFLDALGASRIPDPTTAGDFCRRFDARSIDILQDAIHEARLKVWSRQEPEFFRQAVVEADGNMTPTNGQCKRGMDIAYNGIWGYHPLIVSLANTREPLFVVNRSGNRPSHDEAYMVMASLAWTLKAWLGLLLPRASGRWADRHREQKQQVIRMEFRRFLNTFIRLPCQIVMTGRRWVYRLLSWNQSLEVFLQAFDAISRPIRQ